MKVNKDQLSVYDLLPESLDDLVSSSVRLDDEDFTEYKKRLRVENKIKKLWLRGRMMHDSSKMGTCRK